MVSDIKEYYQCILDNLTGGLISVDLSGKVVYMNPMAGKILHLDEDHKCLGCDYKKAYAGFPALLDVVREALETGKSVRRAEISVMHANVPLVIGYSTMRVRNHDGMELGVTVIFQDISFVASGKK